MKLFAVALLLLVALPPRPETHYFRYQRTVQTPASATGESCVPLDAKVFTNASPELADVRLYRGDTEVPFAIRTAQAPAAAARPVLPLNAGVRDGRTEFDAAMPAGRYGDVELQIDAQNFQAKVEVTGSQALGSSDARRIGKYTIFDLTRERSGRNTVLHLPASDFRYLHFAIDGPIAPQAVTGITVLAAADTPEPAYTTVAENTIAIHEGRTTTVTLQVPARVPVDRVLFHPGAEPAHFSRRVTVRATGTAPSPQEVEESLMPVSFTGTLLRLQDTRDGQKFHEENDSVNTAGTAADVARTWTVTVDNGDDQPLQLGAVQLQMLQRQLCFEPAGAGTYTLRYGDAALPAPQYDYGSQGSSKSDAVAATLGAQQPNPAWVARPDDRAFTERHPLLLWVALVAVIVLLGSVAVRSRHKPGA